MVSFCILSCERRPLDILATSLRINLTNDYSLPHEAASSFPQHFRVNMYDSKTGNLVYQDFVPKDGGYIKNIPGNYLCFVCNYDEGYLTLENEKNMGTFYITAPQAEEYFEWLYNECRQKLRTRLVSYGYGTQTKDELWTDEVIVLSLNDYFWTGQKSVYVPGIAITDKQYVIPLETSSALKQGRITLTGIKGTEYISSMDCFISNLSSGMNPVKGTCSEAPAIETFRLQIQDSLAQSAFLYFGITERQKAEGHLLYVLVTDTGGGKYLYVYDLNTIQEESEMVYTINTNIDIPEPEHQGGGGFTPHIEEWGIEYFNIPIGQ